MYRVTGIGTSLLLIAAGVWYFSLREKPHGNRWGPNPAWAGTGQGQVMPVRVVPAERRDLPVHLKAIGTVTPLNTVTVRSRVDGQLLRVVFEEGQRVEKGQLLAEIDPEPYRIALAQAEARRQQEGLEMIASDVPASHGNGSSSAIQPPSSSDSSVPRIPRSSRHALTAISRGSAGVSAAESSSSSRSRHQARRICPSVGSLVVRRTSPMAASIANKASTAGRWLRGR